MMTAKTQAAGNAAKTAKAAARAVDLAPIIADIRAGGAVTLEKIAAELNERGISAPRGGAWSAVQVQRVAKQADAQAG